MSKKQFNNILLRLSASQDVNEAIKEWECFGLRRQEGDIFQCICGKVIHHCYYFQNKFTRKCIRVGNNCIDKFSFQKQANAVKHSQARKIWHIIINKDKFKIEDIEEYEKIVRKEMIKYYGSKVEEALNDFELEKIREEVKKLKEEDNIDIVEDIDTIISKRKIDIYRKNKDVYLKRKQEWKSKGSLCCSCKYPLPSEKYIKYDCKTKLRYCPYCFEHLDEADKLEKRKLKAQKIINSKVQ